MVIVSSFRLLLMSQDVLFHRGMTMSQGTNKLVEIIVRMLKREGSQRLINGEIRSSVIHKFKRREVGRRV